MTDHSSDAERLDALAAVADQYEEVNLTDADRAACAAGANALRELKALREQCERQRKALDSIPLLLHGIDKEESEAGWWETSVGAKFGAGVLDKIKAACYAAGASVD